MKYLFKKICSGIEAKAHHLVPPFNTQCLQNLAESGERTLVGAGYNVKLIWFNLIKFLQEASCDTWGNYSYQVVTWLPQRVHSSIQNVRTRHLSHLPHRLTLVRWSPEPKASLDVLERAGNRKKKSILLLDFTVTANTLTLYRYSENISIKIFKLNSISFFSIIGSK